MNENMCLKVWCVFVHAHALHVYLYYFTSVCLAQLYISTCTQPYVYEWVLKYTEECLWMCLKTCICTLECLYLYLAQISVCAVKHNLLNVWQNDNFGNHGWKAWSKACLEKNLKQKHWMHHYQYFDSRIPRVLLQMQCFLLGISFRLKRAVRLANLVWMSTL